MKYADKIISLMGAYPDREFRMSALIRYINPEPTEQERRAIKIGVSRVLLELNEVGRVVIIPPAISGGFGLYKWKAIHEKEKSDTESDTIKTSTRTP